MNLSVNQNFVDLSSENIENRKIEHKNFDRQGFDYFCMDRKLNETENLNR